MLDSDLGRYVYHSLDLIPYPFPAISVAYDLHY